MRKSREHVYLVAFLHLCKDGVSSEQLNLAASFPGSWYYARWRCHIENTRMVK